MVRAVDRRRRCSTPNGMDTTLRSWDSLVLRYRGLVWSVARAHRLSDADAADVYQGTWLALGEHLPRIHTPDKVASWLITTASRLSLRVIELRGRELLVDRWEPMSTDPGPEEITIRSAWYRVLWQAFGTLDERCRRLLRIAAHAPELSYPQIARALGMPPASIGSTRGRCLTTLRRRLAAMS